MNNQDYNNSIIEPDKLKNKEILNLKETAQFMGVSESYLYKLTHGKLIKHYKPTGKIIYFKRNDIEEFMLSNYQPTTVEVGNQFINNLKCRK